MYYLGGFLLLAIGIAHSWLGEKYILMRLFRKVELPKLFGDVEFTKSTLRFAWHITSIAWWGFAAILFYLAQGQADIRTLSNLVAATFFLHFLLALLASKARHFSWVVFLAITLSVLYAANT